jgi:hypothetical protein
MLTSLGCANSGGLPTLQTPTPQPTLTVWRILRPGPASKSSIDKVSFLFEGKEVVAREGGSCAEWDNDGSHESGLKWCWVPQVLFLEPGERGLSWGGGVENGVEEEGLVINTKP